MPLLDVVGAGARASSGARERSRRVRLSFDGQFRDVRTAARFCAAGGAEEIILSGISTLAMSSPDAFIFSSSLAPTPSHYYSSLCVNIAAHAVQIVPPSSMGLT